MINCLCVVFETIVTRSHMFVLRSYSCSQCVEANTKKLSYMALTCLWDLTDLDYILYREIVINLKPKMETFELLSTGKICKC
jgi:hypothetical protein